MVTKDTLAILLGSIVYKDHDDTYRIGMIGDSPCNDALERAAVSINEFFAMEQNDV